MKIAVVGCGAMGSVYAARLSRGGHDVMVVDPWSEHIQAIAHQGIHVTGPDGNWVARDLRAFTQVPPIHVDLVVLAVKAAAAAQAAQQLTPLLDETTIVLTIQNGLGSAELVAAAIGAERLAVGIASGFGAGLDAPGQVHHNAMKALQFGAYADLPPHRVEEVAKAWRAGGFDASAVTDILAMQWSKLICNVAYSAPCALTGLTVGQVMDDPEVGPVSRAAAVEAWQTARALHIEIPSHDPVQLVRDFAAAMPAAKPSAQQDHEAHRISEIDVINGAIPREAAKVGLSAPVNDTLTRLVRAREKSWGEQNE